MTDEADTADVPASDYAYFKRIERLFIALRGAPLLLSPADWQVARAWRQQAIPVEVVEEALRQLFARRAEQGKNDPINTLRIARAAVGRAFKAVQQHRAAAAEVAAPEPLDTAARLGRLARALPADCPDRAQFAAAIVALDGDLETVENGLAALDQELLDRAEATLDAPARVVFAAALEHAHGRLGVRLPASELARADSPLRRSVLRRQLDLPVLSLFAIEAMEGE